MNTRNLLGAIGMGVIGAALLAWRFFGAEYFSAYATRVAGALLLGAAVAAGAPTAHAQTPVNYPTQTVTLVVPFPAGGPPDVISRILQPKLQELLGKPVVIENKAGAAGAIAATFVARAAPDGHTLLMIDPALVVAQNLLEKPGFDPLKDFTYVMPTMRSYMGLVINSKLPFKSLGEFLAHAKAKPNDIRYGTSGTGSPPYLGALAFLQATGIEMTHVPYRGVALAVNDVAGGHIDATFVSQATASSQVKGGQVRVLGVYGEQRVRSLPDVPTFREGGVETPVANQGNWFGVAAPAGTPQAIVNKINATFNQALRDPATRALLEKADFDKIEGGTPDEMRKMIEESVTYWKDLFTKAGVKPE